MTTKNIKTYQKKKYNYKAFSSFGTICLFLTTALKNTFFCQMLYKRVLSPIQKDKNSFL